MKDYHEILDLNKDEIIGLVHRVILSEDVKIDEDVENTINTDKTIFIITNEDYKFHVKLTWYEYDKDNKKPIIVIYVPDKSGGWNWLFGLDISKDQYQEIRDTVIRRKQYPY